MNIAPLPPSETKTEKIAAIVNQILLLNLWSNTRMAKTTAYAVVRADSGSTLALGGTAFYAVTFGDPSTFQADFAVMVVNEDSGRAKWISVSGGTSFYLWPRQSVIVFNQNSVWQVQGRSRWRHPGGTLNFFCDFSQASGNDTLGTTDGLASGSAAFKGLQHAMNFLYNEVDFNGLEAGQTLVVVNMAAGVTDTVGLHFSAHAFVGAQGGAAVKVLGGAGAIISTTSTDAIGVFEGAIVQIANVKLITTTGGNCIDADRGAKVELLTGIEFGACAGSHISASNQGCVLINNSYTISGNATTAHVLSTSDGFISNNGGSITATVSANITVGWMVLTSVFAAASLASITFSLGAFAVTGKRYEADNFSLVYTGGGGAAYFPGSVAGTTSGGGTYV